MDLSIVIPFYNEKKNLEPLLQKLQEALPTLPKSHEIIFVDDGSTDGGIELLNQLLRETFPEKGVVKTIRLRRNFGQTAAIAAGIEKSTGEIIILMDADLQNDPLDIPKLLQKIDQGFDVVSGWRKNRKDPLLTRRIPSIIANWLISLITGVRLKDYGCTLKAYRRNVLKGVSLYGEMHRFLPALCAWQGAKIAEVEITHHPRRFGQSKYGLIRTFKILLDLVTVKFLGSYLVKPIYMFGGLGLTSVFAGFVVAVYLIYAKLSSHSFYIINSPLLLLAALLEILGVMFVMMGLLAEIMVRTYHESQGKKPYAVKETIGF